MESTIPNSITPNASVSRSAAALWTGRVLSALVILFLAFDGVMKVIKEPHVIAASAELGYTAHVIVGIGATLLVCTLLYAIPRTNILGALLLTAFLGGAVDANVRAGHSGFQCLFPVIFGALVWGGLLLRQPRMLEIFGRTKASS